MERKMLFKEAVVQIEAAPCVIRTTMFTDPCISEYDSISCYHTCKINKYLLGGTCKKGYIQNKKLVTMKRKILFGMHFFLIILLVAQEAMVQIEACEIICLMFPGECKGFGDNEICNNVCKINEFLFGGYCISGKCICYAKVY
ncbi:uncharacterized protein LOC123883261 isoform X2 [Trifolium pratense]|uniref:uncharacterized protein LOC123883261 isoform X2 n=1 Tax=Trifolium pratense TaxID=57577 RepID=UPI001E68FDC5|nr:uncharacterized protein LOC123883261 isoform X2 [Trifolium pratense]